MILPDWAIFDPVAYRLRDSRDMNARVWIDAEGIHSEPENTPEGTIEDAVDA
jgi:hypothetical protein